MLEGSTVALVTPFKQDLTIDEDCVKRLIDWHIEQGTDCILVGGTTGESATLDHDEHRRLIKLTVDHVGERVPVMAGCGSNCTEESIGLVHFAEEVGADYALVITPYYNKPSQEGLYRHYKAVAASTKLPVILYNVPARTGVNLFPQTVARLYKDCENIIGLKDAAGNIEQTVQTMGLVDDDFILLSGDDALTIPMMALGGRGVISVVANICPHAIHTMVTSYANGKLAEAKRIQLEQYDLVKMMFVETNPIPVKTALSFMDKIEYVFRLPLCEMGEQNAAALKDLMRSQYKMI